MKLEKTCTYITLSSAQFTCSVVSDSLPPHELQHAGSVVVVRKLNCSMLCGSSQFSSVQFSRSVVSDSLKPHELQHARLPCPSPTLGVHSNSCPLSWGCHPTISSSVVPFSSCPQSLSASGSFPMNWFFASSGQSIGVSASASVLPMNVQG